MAVRYDQEGFLLQNKAKSDNLSAEVQANTDPLQQSYPSFYESNLFKVNKKNPEKLNFYIEMTDYYGKSLIYMSGNQEPIIGMILTVNPSTVNVNLSKIVGRTQSMVGWIEDHWGEELDTITFQGSTAAFIYSPFIPTNQNIYSVQIMSYLNASDSITGLTNVAPTDNRPLFTGLAGGINRQNSISYQEFKKIIQIMNGNGAVFDNMGFVSQRVYVQMSYDYASYRGYFVSIDTTEDSASPYKFTYTITFKSEKTIYTFTR
jgi:hypothetical protein